MRRSTRHFKISKGVCNVKHSKEIQGISYFELVEQYGSPLYVYDGNVLSEDYGTLRSSLPPSIDLFYSLKANPNISIYNYLKNLGAGAEVSSLVELMTVKKAGTDSSNIIFLGPGKSDAELEACVREEIFAVVCESFGEMKRLSEIAVREGKEVRVAFRINPSFSVKGSKLTMGGKPRQFGIDEERIFEEGHSMMNLPNVRVIGIHVYMGTRILDEEEVLNNTENILGLADKLSAHLSFELEMVDIGGGLGVPYFEGERYIDAARVGELLAPHLEAFKQGHPNTRLIMELGRYLVGRSGTFVSRVRDVKESRGEKFVVTDGGTNCHMAAVGIGSFVKRNFPIESLTTSASGEIDVVNIAGPLCTPNDLVGKAVKLERIEEGDLVGITNSGAYGPTASPVLFLSHGYPSEVLVHQGESYLIRERDTSEDLIRKQFLHDLPLHQLV